MKVKNLLCTSLAATAFMVMGTKADACTNVIITPGASADGSTLVSYAADSHWLFGELYYHPARDWKEGTMLKVYDWDSGKYLGEIPQAAHTYQTVGNMNEHQLIIAETTFGGREELVNPDGKIDYGSMIYITLQRAKTAREAIKVMTDLADTYIYCSEGETFTIADKNEAWILEMVGKGKTYRNTRASQSNKGCVWVAMRIPDGYICAHANQSRIGNFPLNDPENCLYSEDVINFARRQGYFEGEDDEFNFRDAYCPLTFGALRGCEARVWSAYNILCNGWFTYETDSGRETTVDASNFINYAMGYDVSSKIPLFVKPVRKVTVKQLADVMRDHYEGTPMDMTQDIGAGGNALPYRWRPMDFEYDGVTYTNERAIATQQTGFWFVGQARPKYPDLVGGILWFGTDDAATSYLSPIYTNVTKVPDCFREGNGDLLHYSETASFWINNRVSNACYKMYNYMAPYVRAEVDKFEKEQMEEKIRNVDNYALDLFVNTAEKLKYKAMKKGQSYDPMTDTGDDFKAVKDFLTNYSYGTAQNQFEHWKDLEVTLLVKFMDGNVKAQEKNGEFTHSEFSKKIPAGLTQPGYTELWKQIVAQTHGDVIREVEPEDEAGQD